MSGTKPFASLEPLLLARKGTAKPAMRSAAATLHSDNDVAGFEDDLGWNDMGFDDRGEMDMGDVPVISTGPAVLHQREELVTRIGEHASRQTQRKVPANAGSSRSAFTLRLDPERHLKLKLASAVEGESAQQLVTRALDNFLAERPQLDSLAAQLTRGGQKT